MVSIHELKLGNEKLEALNFLLQNLSDLEEAIKAIDLSELRGINSNVTTLSGQVSEAKQTVIVAKQAFDDSKSDFDAKYNQITSLLTQLNELKGQIENILQNSPITDKTISPTTAYSSQKIEQIKSVIESSIQTLTQTQTSLQSQIQTANQGINSLNQQVADRYTKSEANDRFLHKTATANDSNRLGGVNASDYRKVADSYAKNETYTQAEVNQRLQNITVPLATESTPGKVRLKNSINGNAEDMAVTEKAVNTKLNELENQIIGVNQTWQDMKSQRQNGIVYTNSTGRAISILVSQQQSSTAQLCVLFIDGVEVIKNQSYGTADGCIISAVIPAGSTYKLAYAYAPLKWFELR